MSRPSRSIAATFAQLEMELRLTARRGENVLVTAVVPAVVLVFFASVDVLPIPGSRPVDFLLPGSLALAIVATSLVSLGIATAYERSYGVLKRLGGSPLTRASLLAAKIGAVLVVEVLQIAALLAIAWLVLGWSPPMTTNPPLLILGAGLGTVAFAGLGLLVAGTLRADATLALANALFLATLLLGGVIVPLDQLPGFLGDVASVLPGAALSAVMGVALGGGGETVVPMAILSGWAVGAVVLAARTFRWD